MAGAMEDWGLVSFRSAYLVYDDQVMTPESLRQVTLVIAHELAHQVWLFIRNASYISGLLKTHEFVVPTCMRFGCRVSFFIIFYVNMFKTHNILTLSINLFI